MNRKITIGLAVFLIVLILFDASQQKFYLDSFNLHPDGKILDLSDLLFNHFIRWTIWAVVNVPVSILIWKALPHSNAPISNRSLLIILVGILGGILGSLSIICMVQLVTQNLSWNWGNFSELFIFFTYQKSLTFLLSSVTVTLIIYNLSREKTLLGQFVEIKNLRKKSQTLEQALLSQEEPHLNIKTGYKVYPIPLGDITWIQSDDYCVRIHTEERSYSLRKSMKSLEDELKPYGFIRVHRGALLNLHFLQQVNFEASTIQLANTSEIPLSKTGARMLRQKLAQSAL